MVQMSEHFFLSVLHALCKREHVKNEKREHIRKLSVVFRKEQCGLSHWGHPIKKRAV